MTYQEACQHKTEAYGTVYRITNTVNNKSYVGQTTQPLTLRLRQHKWLGHQSEPKTAIHRALLKYGFDSFTFDVLGVYPNQSELDEAELRFAQTLGTFVPVGYNLRAGQGRGSVSEESRERHRIGSTGRTATDATRLLLADARSEWHASKSASVELERRRRISEATAQTYLFRSPTGERVEVTNLKQWCEENGFTRTQWCKLALVAVGRERSVKGWSLWVEGGEQALGFRKLEHVLRSPEGARVVVGRVQDYFLGLGFTANECASMRKVTRGDRTEFKGWSQWAD